MAADGKLLQGEVNDAPVTPGTDDSNIEGLLLGFVQALIREQSVKTAAESVTHE
jgi:hypothetical protein